ncbi:MAG: minor capsid protein, partial [Cetobacterium sp.]
MKKIMDTKEAANFRYTVKEYMEKIKELGDSKEAEALLKEFNIAAGKVRFQRYEELEAQMQYQALKLSQSTQNIVQEHLTEIIPEVYTRSIFEIQKGIGIGASFNQINPMTIESIINTPWNTKNFSGRIWDNKSILIQNLRRTILGGVMQGQEFKRMSQQLQKQMGGEFYKARRILETETTYVLEKAKEESYNELGIENYIFIATLDNRTSEACQKMDGKVFRNKDRLPGINVPPLHPFCRSALAPCVEGLEDATRIARADSGETYKVPANMTYEEWLKKYPGDGIIKENKEAKNLRKNADKIKSKIKDIGVKGVVDIPPKGMKDFTIDFDDYHINVERNHDITRKEAIKFILDSDLSLSKWEGRFINYY